MGAYIRFYLGVSAFLGFAYVAIRFLLPWILPFFLAFLIAAVIEPLVIRLERLHLPRWLAVLGALGVVFLGAAWLSVLGVVQLTGAVIAASKNLPFLYVQGIDLSGRLLSELDAFTRSLPPAGQEVLQDQWTKLYQLADTAARQALGVLQGLAFRDLPRWLVTSLVTAIATFFLSRDRHAIGAFLRGLLPPSIRPRVAGLQSELLQSASGLLRAQLYLLSLTFVGVWAGLSFLGVEYPIALAALSALLDLLPALGPGLLFLPWSAWLAWTGEVPLAVSLLLLYGGVSLVRFLLQAYVIGESLGLHPLAVLLALYLGVEALGVTGFLWGPVIAILLKASLAAGLLPGGEGGPPAWAPEGRGPRKGRER